VREALDELVLPPSQLEELEHLAHAAGNADVLETVEAAVKSQELAGRELLVDERPVGDEAQRCLGLFGVR
jgi:hypothetical protein